MVVVLCATAVALLGQPSNPECTGIMAMRSASGSVHGPWAGPTLVYQASNYTYPNGTVSPPPGGNEWYARQNRGIPASQNPPIGNLQRSTSARRELLAQKGGGDVKRAGFKFRPPSTTPPNHHTHRHHTTATTHTYTHAPIVLRSTPPIVCRVPWSLHDPHACERVLDLGSGIAHRNRLPPPRTQAPPPLSGPAQGHMLASHRCVP